MDQFLPFYSHNNLKNQNFEKMKKEPQEIIILQICTKNENHIMHGSWDIEHNGQNFLAFCTIFCPFMPLTTWKMKIFKNFLKKPGNILILHMCAINDNHMMYGSWHMKSDRQNFLSFWTVLCLFTPLTTRKIKILENWKKQLEISSFYTSVPKIMITHYTVR